MHKAYDFLSLERTMHYVDDIFGTIRPASRPVWLHRVGVLGALVMLSALVALFVVCILSTDENFYG